MKIDGLGKRERQSLTDEWGGCGAVASSRMTIFVGERKRAYEQY